jgi:hypothetical protein
MTPNDRPMSAAPRETVTLAQLQSIEWCARSPFFTDIMVCPACRRPRPGRETEHRSGHDPDCWLAAAILSLRETPPAVPSPEMPVIEAGDEIHYGARLFMRVHGTTADFCITADGPVPKRDVRAVFRDDGMKKIRE